MEYLIIRAGALGDVVLTLPAIRALRVEHPGARITVVGYPKLWSIAGDLVNAVESIDVARFSTLFTDHPSDDLVAWLTRFDRAIAWTVRSPLAAFRAARLSEVTHASPYPLPGIHVADWLLQTAGLPSPPPPDASGAHREEGVYLHPGAGAVWKRWPAGRFAALADALRARGFPVSLIEGPADRDAVEAVQRSASSPLPSLREPALPSLRERLARASLYVGNDSGVTHLAAAAGTPTIALFGPTDPACWAPLGPATVLRRCTTHTSRQGEIRVCTDPACMERIAVDDVLEAAVSILRGGPGAPPSAKCR